MSSSRREVDALLLALDQAYDRKSWHGTNLRGSIRGVSAGQAAWRPSRGRHSIHELVVHAAYWKNAAWRRLTGGKRGSFPIEGSNWFTRLDADWKADVALLDRMHRLLREAVAALPPAALHRSLPGSALMTASLISGITAHDLYHAGQIQLLKALHE